MARAFRACHHCTMEMRFGEAGTGEEGVVVFKTSQRNDLQGGEEQRGPGHFSCIDSAGQENGEGKHLL